MAPHRKALVGMGVWFSGLAAGVLALSLTMVAPERACEEAVRNWPQLNAWASEIVLKPLVLLLKAC